MIIIISVSRTCWNENSVVVLKDDASSNDGSNDGGNEDGIDIGNNGAIDDDDDD